MLGKLPDHLLLATVLQAFQGAEGGCPGCLSLHQRPEHIGLRDPFSQALLVMMCWLSLWWSLLPGMSVTSSWSKSKEMNVTVAPEKFCIVVSLEIFQLICPCFDNSWKLIGMHISHGPNMTQSGRKQSNSAGPGDHAGTRSARGSQVSRLACAFHRMFKKYKIPISPLQGLLQVPLDFHWSLWLLLLFPSSFTNYSHFQFNFFSP